MSSNNYEGLSIQQLRTLAEGGPSRRPDVAAQFRIGQRYQAGVGGAPQDDREAVRWYRRAAEQGYAEAQCMLGGAYAAGVGGLSKDEREAVRWYRLAADQGDAEAQLGLAFAYHNGEGGLPQDDQEAVRWCRLAAERGNAQAQTMLGDAYANGMGVPKDKQEAARSYRLNADHATALANEQARYDAAVKAMETEHPELNPDLPDTYNQNLIDQLLGLKEEFEAKGESSTIALSNALRVLYKGGKAPEEKPEKKKGAAQQRHEEGQPASDGLVLDTNSITKFLEDAFAGFVGLESVRDEVLRQASYIRLQKLRAVQGLRVPTSPSRHLVFLGNPGTGKTTIARIIARLYHRLGVLKTDKVIETDRAGLVAPFIGQTALKTREIVKSALGGVLFIDEAYTLARGGDGDFGKEAIETLIKMMEDHRDELVVIVAGYEAEMDAFIKLNPGLESRFNRYIRFPNYTPEDLLMIFRNFCNEYSCAVSETMCHGLSAIFRREIQAQRQRFGNARYVRNLFEKVIEAQAHRLVSAGNTGPLALRTILTSDVEAALGEPLPVDSGPSANYEAALQRLSGLIGLNGVKQQVQRLFDFIRMQRARAEAGSKAVSGFSQHLVFTGNPGTGKTTVARIIADLYSAMGVIPSSRVVEVDRSSLVAGYIGQSAIKTREVVESALGGVLFIDEAYALANGGEAQDFGQEVIDTLLKAMEDNRDQLVVIVAGYREPMEKFINSNPGLRSRFNRYIEFEDYQPDDLAAIFDSLCRNAEYALDSDARTFLSENLARLFRSGKTAANGRFVRNLYERCVEVQSQRVSRQGEMRLETLNAITLFDVAGAMKEIVKEKDRK